MSYRLYDFECSRCHRTFEKMVGAGEDVAGCPVCDGDSYKLPPLVRCQMGEFPYGGFDQVTAQHVTSNADAKRKRQEFSRNGNCRCS